MYQFFGCELWALNNDDIELFCIAWRKALRRVIGVPCNAHSYLLPLLSNLLPIFDELCKRSARFISSCLLSSCHLVRQISSYCVTYAKHRSVLGSNAILCCDRFGWSRDSFYAGLPDLSNTFFQHRYYAGVSDIEYSNALTLLELLFVREGRFVLPSFSKEDIMDMINLTATA